MQSREKESRDWKETAAGMVKNRAALAKLAQSGDAQKLMSLLQKQGGIREAAGAAAEGDPARLLAMVEQLMKSPQGAELVGRIGNEARKAGLKD